MAFGLTDKMIQPIVMYETDQAENTKRKLEDNTLPGIDFYVSTHLQYSLKN